MKLKVCGMREPNNAKDLVTKVQPDWMGLIFYPPSPRFVLPTHAEGIRDLSVKKVGVFVNADLDTIKENIDLFGLETLQLHGGEDANTVKRIKEETQLEIFKVFSVGASFSWGNLSEYLPYVDYFLFDTFTKDYGGSGKVFDWGILKDYPYEKPFLLSGGIDISMINEIKNLKQTVSQLAGVDINSRFETTPGIKDVEKVGRFWERLDE